MSLKGIRSANIGRDGVESFGQMERSTRQPSRRKAVPTDAKGNVLPRDGNNPDAVTEQYEVPVGPNDSRDTTMNFLRVLQDKGELEKYLPGVENDELRSAILGITGRNKLGEPVPNSSMRLNVDAHEISRYAQSKAEEIEFAKFQDYAASKFDLRDPTQLQMYNRIMPEILSQKEKIIDNAYDVSKTMHKINLRGIRTREDLYTCYMVETGQLQPAEAIFDGIPGYNKDSTGSYTPGMFNPMKYNVGAINQMSNRPPNSTSGKGYFNYADPDSNTGSMARNFIASGRQNPNPGNA